MILSSHSNISTFLRMWVRRSIFVARFNLSFSQALRHSKVKLTWDQDDPERNKVTRRALTKKEIDEEDFRAYIASSSDESDREGPRKGASRDRLRSLLAGGAKDELPEGWGNFNDHAGDEDDVDMEVTFMPGLTDEKGEDETTLEKYQRKLKEKRKKKKEEAREVAKEKETQQKKPKQPLDDFFDAGSESEEDAEETKKRKEKKAKAKDTGEPRTAATAEELALLVASDKPNGARHFDMSAVLKAEKKSGKKGKKGRKEKHGPNDQDTQEDFHINVADERFKALHEDHSFAIDPSNPR